MNLSKEGLGDLDPGDRHLVRLMWSLREEKKSEIKQWW